MPYGDHDEATPAPESRPPAQLRHCWVVDEEHGRLPALLLEWRRAGEGWEGRVVAPVYDDVDDRWRPRDAWLPAGDLERA